MNQFSFDPCEPIIPQSIALLPLETLQALASKELERQARSAISRFPREPDGRYPLEAARVALHAIKRHMPCQAAIEFSQAIYDATRIDARDVRQTRQSAPLALDMFAEPMSNQKRHDW